MKISFDGSPRKEGFSRLDPSIALWFVVKDAVSLGKVCGKLRFL
jgi:hypothetical protein